MCRFGAYDHLDTGSNAKFGPIREYTRRFHAIRAQACRTILDQYDLARVCLPKMMAFIQKLAEAKDGGSGLTRCGTDVASSSKVVFIPAHAFTPMKKVSHLFIGRPFIRLIAIVDIKLLPVLTTLAVCPCASDRRSRRYNFNSERLRPA